MQRVLIVGGGSAGWLTACYVDALINGEGPKRVGFTVFESPSVGRIGVGEATIPSIRARPGSWNDFDNRKLERLCKEYMSMRKEIWQPLASRCGEKWNVVEMQVCFLLSPLSPLSLSAPH